MLPERLDPALPSIGEDSGALDKRLLAEVAAKNEVALTQLYRRFSAPLFSIVYHILGDQRDTEDTIQETFVQIWKRAAAYDPNRGNALSWAVMIARNKAIDRIRSRQRQSRAQNVLTEECAHQPPLAAPANAERNDERARVQFALARLPEDQRQALELAFFRGLTQLEVSTELNTPLGTIKARIRRGLLSLRDFLKRQ